MLCLPADAASRLAVMVGGRGINGVMAGVLCVSTAMLPAQQATQRKAFDAVSIRRIVPPARVPQVDAPTADGYRLSGLGVIVLILAAYGPQSSGGTMLAPNNIVGLPAWAWANDYEIDARVSEADRADWQDAKKQPGMLHEMLQSLLADRFHLVAHRELRPSNIYSLQLIHRGGPKFRVAAPDEPHPGAVALGDGAFLRIDYGNGVGTRHYYNITMANFAALMSNIAQRTVRDGTGLTGRFDLSFQNPTRLTAPSATTDADDSAQTIFSAMQELGLKLKPMQGESEVLVIDHIEPPTEN